MRKYIKYTNNINMKTIKDYINEMFGWDSDTKDTKNTDDINWANIQEVIKTFKEYEYGRNIELRTGDGDFLGTLDRLGSYKFVHEMKEADKNEYIYTVFHTAKNALPAKYKKRNKKAYDNLFKNIYDKYGRAKSFFTDERDQINFDPKILSDYYLEIISSINFYK